MTSTETSDELERLLQEWSSLPEPDRRIRAFTFVRNIAYGDIGSRNPLDVLKQKKGTCSGKHALLKIILERMGYKVQCCFAKHDFSMFPIQPWPEELREFASLSLPDYHDFLKVMIDDEWVSVDAIFDPPLKALGFPVQDWDGVHTMKLPVKVQKFIPVHGDAEQCKSKLINDLPQRDQLNRKRFLVELTRWIDSKR